MSSEGWPGTRPSLGIDFVKIQHLAIDASGPHFTEASRLLPDDICPMFMQSEEVCVPPRTVRRLTVNPRASSGLKCPPGTTGVVSSDTDDYGIWDAACTVQQDCSVDVVFANTSRACQNQHRVNMSLDMSSSASSETATKHAVTCLSLPRVVACSPSSLHRLGA